MLRIILNNPEISLVVVKQGHPGSLEIVEEGITSSRDGGSISPVIG